MEFDLFYKLSAPGFAGRSEARVFHETRRRNPGTPP